MVFLTGCDEAKSVSVLLRGGTDHVVDEIRRAFDDAIGVVSVAHEDGAVLTGGGSVLAAQLAVRTRSAVWGPRRSRSCTSSSTGHRVTERDATRRGIRASRFMLLRCSV